MGAISAFIRVIELAALHAAVAVDLRDRGNDLPGGSINIGR